MCWYPLKVADTTAFDPAGTLAPAPLTLGEQRERQENRVKSDEAKLQMLESRLQAP